MHAPAVEKGIGTDEEAIDSLAREVCKGRVDLANGASIEDLDLQPDGASCRCHISHGGLGIGGICRIDEYSHASGGGHQLAHEFQPLCHDLTTEKIDTCEVAARPGEAGDKTKLNRVFGGGEDNGDRRGRRLGRQHHSGTSERCDHRDLAANQVDRKRRQPIDLILGPAVFDRRPRHSRSLSGHGEIRANGPRSCQAIGCGGTRLPASPAAARARRAATRQRRQ